MKKIEITDELIKKETRYTKKIALANPLPGCRNFIKPIKKNGKWGRVVYNIHYPFLYAYKAPHTGIIMFVDSSN